NEALDVAKPMTGWTIVASDADAGRIEASQQSRWFRFTDDIVIRVVGDEAGSRIDMRPTSRQGRSDYGVNAARIRSKSALGHCDPWPHGSSDVGSSVRSEQSSC